MPLRILSEQVLAVFPDRVRLPQTLNNGLTLQFLPGKKE